MPKISSLALVAALGLAPSGLSAQARSMEQDPSLNNLVHPEGTETLPLGRFGHVERRGEGPVPMVLVPGGGFGWEVFGPFVDDHLAEYTMYAVSLAGMGGTSPPPMPPEGTSYGEQTWTRGAVDALVTLIEEESLARPLVVGFFLEGSQVGVRMAVDHPDLVRGVVLLAGTPVMDSPGRSYTVEERVRYQDEFMAPKWFKTVTRHTWNDNNFPPESYSRDPERGRRLFEQVSGAPLPVVTRYLMEFWASDLRLELDDVGVPVLVLSPDFEASLLEDEATAWLAYYFVDPWEGVAELPLVDRRVVDDAHLFVWLDHPALVSEAIARFAERVSPPRSEPVLRRRRARHFPP